MHCLVKGIGSSVIYFKASMYHIVNKKARVRILYDILGLNVFSVGYNDNINIKHYISMGIIYYFVYVSISDKV